MPKMFKSYSGKRGAPRLINLPKALVSEELTKPVIGTSFRPTKEPSFLQKGGVAGKGQGRVIRQKLTKIF
jgi:hypothetical protein